MPSYQFKLNGTPIRGGAVFHASGPVVVSCVSDHPIGWYSINYDGGDPDKNNISSVKVDGAANEWRYENTLGPGFYNVRTSAHGTPEVPGGTEGGWINFEIRQTAQIARWNGTISDDGDVTKNAKAAKDLGFDTMRLWANWYSTGFIAQAHAYLAAGMNVIICLTPNEGDPTVDYPHATLAAMKKPEAQGGLSRKVIVQIINEANLENYWPQANWRDAFKTASQISAELQPAGFKTASPSFTYQNVDSIKNWWKDAIASGWTNFDYVDGHSYPRIQPWEDVSAAVSNFREVVSTYRAIADSLGKKTMLSEWGMYGDKTKFAAAWPQLDAIVKEKTHASAYFIMRPGRHGEFGLHLIGSDGKPTTLGKAAEAVKQGGVA